MEFQYTDEKNVLLLIALLKAYNIKRVIVSPGTTNFTFVGSLQNDDFFQLYSCVDERSAAYMACGMTAETGEPVVITCTGATASRNYLPGLTEAYYRKLPILAVCGHRGVSAIGHLHDQQVDRRNEPVDVAVKQVWLPFVKDDEDEKLCYNEIIRAILALSIHGGGPAIVNLCTHYSQNLTVQELPIVNKVDFYSCTDILPELPNCRIAICLGSHKNFSKEENKTIDIFCASHDAIVICDHTSGYYGKYAIHAGLIFGQDRRSDLANIDLCISAGEISADMGVLHTWAPVVWRIGEDGEFRNRTNNVTKVFDMTLAHFCKRYIKDGENDRCDYLRLCQDAFNEVYAKIPKLPFSKIWIAHQLSNRIPRNSNIYLGILGSIRSWNFFNLPANVLSYCNVGGYGIDGTISSAVGQAIACPNKIIYCVLGDLAFFYDMNALGNRHIGNNLRILLINNGLGDEFRVYDNPTGFLGEMVRPYISAEGHYGKKSLLLVKSYTESLGYKYLMANNKESFKSLIEDFVNPEIKQSMVLEAMIRPEDDTDALDMIKHIMLKEPKTLSLKKKIKNAVKSKLGEDKINALHTLLK